MKQKGKTEFNFEEFLNFYSKKTTNLAEYRDSLQRNLLHIVCLEQELGIIRYLVTNYESLINQLDLDKQTPLSLSIREEKFFVARLLLLHNADPKVGGGTFGSSLHMATTKL